MIEMNPYYAHESSVGPVFDVANWSPRKAWMTGIVALLFGVLIATALVAAWQPTLLVKKPPEVLADLHTETLKLQRDKPWVAYGGTGIVALVGALAFAGACASCVDGLYGNYYFRVGPGGISARFPHGLDFTKLGLVFKPLELELPFDDLADWTVVQNKQLGSLSRNAGNTTAWLKIKTVDGRRDAVSLDCFREPAHVIHSRIEDALEMVPANLGPATDRPMAETEPSWSTATR